MRATNLHTLTALLAAGAAAVSLSACAGDEPIDDITWQITNVYADPSMPSEVPAESAGTAVLVFGASTFAGNTGCAAMRGRVHYTDEEGKRARPLEAAQVELFDVSFDDPECDGQRLYLHHELEKIVPNTFLITRRDHELLLKRSDNTLDSPAIRMVS